MKKNIIIISISIVLLILSISIGFYILTNNTEDNTVSTETGSSVPDNNTALPTRDDSEIYNAIENDIKNTESARQTTFDMTDLKQTEPGWYLAKIHDTSDGTVGDAWIVLKDTGGSLVTVAGPGTYFPKSLPIPDSVRKAMR